MSRKTRDWLIALSYVALIYATLEVAGAPLAFLRSHGVLRLSIEILASLALVVVVSFVVKNHSISLWRYAALGIIAIIYSLAARTVKTPEEQVHFFEYGLVGIFFFRALTHHSTNAWKLWTLAFVLASVAGFCDEVLQGLTPHRHYDLHDVFLNAISAFLGLFVYAISKPSKTHR